MYSNEAMYLKPSISLTSLQMCLSLLYALSRFGCGCESRERARDGPVLKVRSLVAAARWDGGGDKLQARARARMQQVESRKTWALLSDASHRVRGPSGGS